MSVWKTITDFPSYEVSDAGEVRNVVTGLVLKGGLCSNGYRMVTLPGNKSMSVHRLVALHFIEKTDNKPMVDHIDRDKTNNRVTNLRWVTRNENNLNKDYFAQKTDGTHYIKITHCQTFQLRISGRTVVSKCFKTLEEAIAFRDQFMVDNPR